MSTINVFKCGSFPYFFSFLSLLEPDNVLPFAKLKSILKEKSLVEKEKTKKTGTTFSAALLFHHNAAYRKKSTTKELMIKAMLTTLLEIEIIFIQVRTGSYQMLCDFTWKWIQLQVTMCPS